MPDALPKQIKFRLYPQEIVEVRKHIGNIPVSQPNSNEAAVGLHQLYKALTEAEKNSE